MSLGSLPTSRAIELFEHKCSLTAVYTNTGIITNSTRVDMTLYYIQLNIIIPRKIYNILRRESVNIFHKLMNTALVAYLIFYKEVRYIIVINEICYIF